MRSRHDYPEYSDIPLKSTFEWVQRKMNRKESQSQFRTGKQLPEIKNDGNGFALNGKPRSFGPTPNFLPPVPRPMGPTNPLEYLWQSNHAEADSGLPMDLILKLYSMREMKTSHPDMPKWMFRL